MPYSPITAPVGAYLAAIGDLITASAVGVPARIAVGAANTVLASNGTTPGYVSSLAMAGAITTDTTFRATGVATLTSGFQAAAASAITAGALTLGSNTATDAIQLILNGTSGTNRAVLLRSAGTTIAGFATSGGNTYLDYQGTVYFRSSSVSFQENMALSSGSPGVGGALTGLASLIATSLTGTLTAGAQTGITAVGTLASLIVSGATSSGTLALTGTGFILTGANAGTSNTYFSLTNNLGSLIIGIDNDAGTYAGVAYGAIIRTSGAQPITFLTTALNRWQITAAGHFMQTSGDKDIGVSGHATSPRTGYFGTSVVTPLVTTTSLTTTSISASGAVSVGTFGVGGVASITGVATLTSGFTALAASSITAGALTIGSVSATDSTQLYLVGTSGTDRAMRFREGATDVLVLAKSASTGHSYFDYSGTLYIRSITSGYAERIILTSAGALTGLTSIGVASLTVSAAVTVGTTLGVTGASTLAALSATNVSVTGTLGVTGTSTLGAVTATSLSVAGAFSFTSSTVSGTATNGNQTAGVRNTGAQSIAASSNVLVTYDTSSWSVGVTYTSSSRFMPTVAGIYIVTATGFLASTGVNNLMDATIVVNGATVIAESYVSRLSGYPSAYSLAGTFKFNGSSDYVEVYINHSAGGSLGLTNSRFTIAYIANG